MPRRKRPWQYDGTPSEDEEDEDEEQQHAKSSSEEQSDEDDEEEEHNKKGRRNTRMRMRRRVEQEYEEKLPINTTQYDIYPSMTTTTTTQHHQPPPPTAIGASMAQRYLEKFNFKGRLGKHEQGIAAPVEVMQRPEFVGLGMVQEATSLPENRANTEHLEMLRRIAHEKERMAQEKREELARLRATWRMEAYMSEPLPHDDELVQHDNQAIDTVLTNIDDLLKSLTLKEQTLQQSLTSMEALTSARRHEISRLEHASTTVDSQARLLSELSQSILHPLSTSLHSIFHDFSDREQFIHAIQALVHFFSSTGQKEEEQQPLHHITLENILQGLFEEMDWSMQDRCHFVVETVQHMMVSSSHAEEYEMAVVHVVLRRIVKDMTAWHGDSIDPLHLIVFPWLPMFDFKISLLLKPSLQALGREMGKWRDLSTVDEIEALLKPWPSVISMDELRQAISDAVAPRLCQECGAEVIVEWWSRGLLGTLETICSLEICALLPLKLALTDHLLAGKFASAAMAYITVRNLIPDVLLRDSLPAIGGMVVNYNRLRAHLDANLERIHAALNNSVVDGAIMAASEPFPSTYSKAIAHARATYPRQTQVIVGDTGGGNGGGIGDGAGKESLRQILLRTAHELGIIFVSSGQHNRDGQQLHQFGNVKVTIIKDVIYVDDNDTEYRPISLPELCRLAVS